VFGQTDHIHIINRIEFMASEGYIKKRQKNKTKLKKPLTVAGPSACAQQQLLALHDAARPQHEGSPDAP
jgi:hypothetical protein